MECKLRISIAFTIAAISLFYFAIEHRRRRNRRKFSKKSCYLSFEYKPQSTFKRVLADNSYSPFKHLKLSNCSDEILSNLHPYEEEIMALLKNPRINSRIFDGISMLGMSKSHIWVESVSQLRELVDVLSEEKIFAVDTEQHSLRSFLGFTALLQISTLKEDYLVDTIALHDTIHMLQFVFSDPNIVKVFHGADNDVLWLQRDFHIYVVNLFDTAKACEVLSKPQKSLAYLLETYCGVATNKLLQREDWRQRPLPDDMVEYARLDAHYLLYITKCLIKELEAEDNDVSQPTEFAPQEDRLHFLLEASRRSNAASLQLFSKVSDVFPGESVASSMISRYLNNQRVASPKNFGAQFQNHIRTLCAWRDIMARVHDESLRFVLSDQAIIALAEKRPISEREVYTIISIADEDNDPLSSSFGISPSPLICSHWEDVCCLLKEEQSSSLDDNLHMLLLNHLGPNGSCPLSTYNYNILSGSNLKLANGSICMQNSVRSGKLVMHKASRKELFVKKFSCKAPVYHNCRIYASDGRLLCYCDRKKLEWYLGRNLAELVDDNPPAIMLLFEPKGRPEAEGNDFYAQSKKNMCVSCGESNHYLRYRIIPSCYRMHFPEHLKSHRSHDIVLLCVDCHEVAHAAAEKHKRQVAAEFGIPLYVKKVADSRELQLTETSEVHGHQEAGVSPLQLRTAAMALLRHGSRMPSKRHEELIEIVKTYYGGRAISHEDLEAALLVGMSPNGRRKFKKKRMATYQQASTGSDNIPGNNSFSMLETINHCSSETSRPSGSPNVKYQASSFDQLANEPVTDIKAPLSASVNDIREDAFAIDGVRVPRTLAARGISDAQDVTLLNTGNICDRNPSEATTSSGLPNFDGKKCNSKVSLLGHGPHGKEVVDYLLKNYGEDGVHSFCQRWREVFVDALHPRHLPAGWDVKHSGKRAFGEFSVYNPLKKG